MPLFLLCTILFSAANAAPLKATIDPTELAVGGRPLGMGRAYVGVADDIYSVFQNTAGLCAIKNLQVASMYSRLIEEVDYSLLGVAHSMSREAVALNYVRLGASGGFITKRDPVTERIVPDSEDAIGYNSSVWLFSYAVMPGKYLTSYPFLENICLGTNLKLFNQSLTGLATRDASAQGFDVDLGVTYQPLTWLKLGAAGYNVLSYEMGGRLAWTTGNVESIPASYKLGGAVKVIGTGGLREFLFYPQELILSLDYEGFFKSNRKSLTHLGAEWSPLEALSLRLGLDQDEVAVDPNQTGVETNFSAGIGYNIADFRLDYAFHTFGEFTQNNTHFFSISYGIKKEFAPYVPEWPKTVFEILEPAPKSITFGTHSLIKGRVLDQKLVKEISIGEEKVPVFQDGSFNLLVKLADYGRNTIEVKALGETRRILQTEKITVVRLISFTDVGEGHPLRINLGAMAVLGYVKGFADGTFKPEGNITRAEFCTLLIRMKATEEAGQPAKIPFADLSARHWAAPYIAAAAQKGYVKGYPDKTFRPNNNISRAEALMVVSKFAGLEEPSYIYEDPFPDVKLEHWAAKAISAAKKAGFLDYLKARSFEPNKKITRGEVADILSKVSWISKNINDLIDP